MKMKKTMLFAFAAIIFLSPIASNADTDSVAGNCDFRIDVIDFKGENELVNIIENNTTGTVVQNDSVVNVSDNSSEPEKKISFIKKLFSRNSKSTLETAQTVAPAVAEENVDVVAEDNVDIVANNVETVITEENAEVISNNSNNEVISGEAVINSPVAAAPVVDSMPSAFDNVAVTNSQTTQINNAIFNSMTTGYIEPSFLTQSQREAAKLANKYAAGDWTQTVEPVDNLYDSKSLWVRPYASFESVAVRKLPQDVSNVSYGVYVGGDSQIIEMDGGWDYILGLHVGYNGSHQTWGGNSAYQNGGTFGITNTFFKGNFFDSLTFGAGASAGSADLLINEQRRYMEDDFGMFNTGVANRIGYNWELADGKFVIQPSILASYTYVYTHKSNVPYLRYSTNQHLHSIGLEPGIKFIGTFGDGWQPYAGISIVSNMMSKKYNFRPYQTAIPELACKPFVRYSLGLKKTWSDTFAAFIQTQFTTGGRNGVGLQAGFRWFLGH